MLVMIMKLKIRMRTYRKILSIEFLLLSFTTDRLHSTCCTFAARYVRNAISEKNEPFVVFIYGEHVQNYRCGS